MLGTVPPWFSSHPNAGGDFPVFVMRLIWKVLAHLPHLCNGADKTCLLLEGAK